MKTDEHISLLAADPAPEPNTVTRRFTVALALGIVGAYLLMVWTHGVRADLAQATVEAMFWGKLIFAGSLAFAALIATQRLGHPGVRLGGVRLALAAPVLALWLVAILVLLAAAPAQRSHLILGETWSTCAFSIAMISVPPFLAMLWALRGLSLLWLAPAPACWPDRSAQWRMRCTVLNPGHRSSLSGMCWASRFQRWPGPCWGRGCCGGSS